MATVGSASLVVSATMSRQLRSGQKSDSRRDNLACMPVNKSSEIHQVDNAFVLLTETDRQTDREREDYSQKKQAIRRAMAIIASAYCR